MKYIHHIIIYLNTVEYSTAPRLKYYIVQTVHKPCPWFKSEILALSEATTKAASQQSPTFHSTKHWPILWRLSTHRAHIIFAALSGAISPNILHAPNDCCSLSLHILRPDLLIALRSDERLLWYRTHETNASLTSRLFLAAWQRLSCSWWWRLRLTRCLTHHRSDNRGPVF